MGFTSDNDERTNGGEQPARQEPKRPVSGQRPRRREFLIGGAVLLASAVGLAAWRDDSSGDGARRVSADDKAASGDATRAKISITPANGTADAGIHDSPTVTINDGTLTGVTVTTMPGGADVKGSLSPDKRSWRPQAPLSRATTYKVMAHGRDSTGQRISRSSSFTTVSAAGSFIGTFTPEDGSRVGVGMPVSVLFDKPVRNKKEVEEAITVRSTSGQRVVGHWFGDRRLDLRPEEYWRAGSRVTLTLALDGVDASPGVRGVQRRTVAFTVGRSQVSTVDAARHTMTVVRDGKKIRTVPISAGSDRTPTYNGQMVISEKHRETRMDGSTVGFGGEYDIPDVPHAMRLSTSGTFIHGNYWSNGVFGNRNTSHGCVGLQDTKGAADPSTDGAWFYENSLLGDIVIVKNSPDTTIKPDNGLNAWNMPWTEWVAGSART
ncbi:Ig-like domain-containing protein [Streptomyces sp. x-80]|uniref:L,D-transpeptidase n=1 Tax=Streptomyces sp. x-80 TaxID=2789282 RepID=UPI00397F3D75